MVARGREEKAMASNFQWLRVSFVVRNVLESDSADGGVLLLQGLLLQGPASAAPGSATPSASSLPSSNAVPFSSGLGQLGKEVILANSWSDTKCWRRSYSSFSQEKLGADVCPRFPWLLLQGQLT